MFMRRQLKIAAITVALLGMNNAAIAENLDADTIKKIHDQVTVSFAAKCNKEMAGATEVVCSCLGQKAQSYLDDTALSLCANDDSGSECITKAVSDAATKAMSQENIAACIATSETVKKSESAEVPGTVNPPGSTSVISPPPPTTPESPVVPARNS